MCRYEGGELERMQCELLKMWDPSFGGTDDKDYSVSGYLKVSPNLRTSGVSIDYQSSPVRVEARTRALLLTGALEGKGNVLCRDSIP